MTIQFSTKVSNKIEVYEESLPWTKNISAQKKFPETGEKNRIISETFEMRKFHSLLEKKPSGSFWKVTVKI